MNPAIRLFILLVVGLQSFSAVRAQDAAGVDYEHDSREMEKARKALRHHHGGQINYFLQADRLEFQSNGGSGPRLFEAQGWVGGDYQKFWFKTEGESAAGGEFEEAEVQGLYSRAVSPFFDFQAGVRQDLAPGARRTFGVVGFQGLAPYWLEVDTALFVSHEGDVSARLEAEYELRFTQRLIFQPRAEINLAVQDVEELAIGSGLSTAQVGARLRYEFKREFAPYLGISWTRATGRTAQFTLHRGEDPGSFSIVAGLRLWF